MPSASSDHACSRTALAVATLACVAASPAAAATTTAELLHPSLPGRLSDERTLTRWTTALDPVAIRRRPSGRSGRIARLRYYTEDRQPEVYVGLEQAVGADGRTWIRIRIPRRPNGTTGWVPAGALNGWHVARRFLAIDRRGRTAVLREGDRVLWRARVAVGRRSTPTPTGRFYVRERISNLAGNPAYGPVAFGTSAYSRLSDWPGGGVIGIHGTNQPGLIPGRASHGCVRIRNRAIRRLARLLPIGTPVRITDGSAR